MKVGKMRGQMQATHQQTQLVDMAVGFRMACRKKGAAQRANTPASIQAMVPRIFTLRPFLPRWVMELA